jgi:hypothetical protein
MDDKILWGALGGLVATLFNVLYNYVREATNRRWQVATDVAGTLDYYYERAVRLIAHQESVQEEHRPILTDEELRSLTFDVGPVLIDAQQVKTRLALVFGEPSDVLEQYESLLGLLKSIIDDGLKVTRPGWIKEGPELRQRINDLNRRRTELRDTLVRQAKVRAVLRAPRC